MLLFSSGRSASDIERIKNESLTQLNKHQGRVIVYLQKLNTSKNDLPNLKNNKYLIPQEFKFSEFCHAIRKYFNLQSTEALYYFIGQHKVLPSQSQTMGELYQQHKDEDLRLYVYYDTENTFGF